MGREPHEGDHGEEFGGMESEYDSLAHPDRGTGGDGDEGWHESPVYDAVGPVGGEEDNTTATFRETSFEPIAADPETDAPLPDKNSTSAIEPIEDGPEAVMASEETEPDRSSTGAADGDDTVRISPEAELNQSVADELGPPPRLQEEFRQHAEAMDAEYDMQCQQYERDVGRSLTQGEKETILSDVLGDGLAGLYTISIMAKEHRQAIEDIKAGGGDAAVTKLLARKIESARLEERRKANRLAGRTDEDSVALRRTSEEQITKLEQFILRLGVNEDEIGW